MKRAFFYLGTRAEGSFSGYPHLALVLAEGLLARGWRISSDVRYWQDTVDGGFLFPGDASERAQEADLVVFAEDYFLLSGTASLQKILSQISCPSVYLDRSDMGNTTRLIYRPEFRKLDLIFRCHSSSGLRYPANVRPIVFGISDRIAAATLDGANGSRSGVVWNFRNKRHPHTVRRWAQTHVRPLLESRMPIDLHIDAEEREADGYEKLMLAQTEGRHSSRYFESLRRSLVCACFGGWFLFPIPQTEAGTVSLIGRRIFKSLPLATPVVAQWDSWRLWEAFAAGAAVLHLDFEKHGFMTGGDLPQPMKHYVAVESRNPAKSLLPLLESPETLREIGSNGAIWARKHYSSNAIAGRLLVEVGLA